MARESDDAGSGAAACGARKSENEGAGTASSGGSTPGLVRRVGQFDSPAASPSALAPATALKALEQSFRRPVVFQEPPRQPHDQQVDLPRAAPGIAVRGCLRAPHASRMPWIPLGEVRGDRRAETTRHPLFSEQRSAAPRNRERPRTRSVAALAASHRTGHARICAAPVIVREARLPWELRSNSRTPSMRPSGWSWRRRGWARLHCVAAFPCCLFSTGSTICRSRHYARRFDLGVSSISTLSTGYRLPEIELPYYSQTGSFQFD